MMKSLLINISTLTILLVCCLINYSQISEIAELKSTVTCGRRFETSSSVGLGDRDWKVIRATELTLILHCGISAILVSMCDMKK